MKPQRNTLCTLKEFPLNIKANMWVIIELKGVETINKIYEPQL